MTGMTLTDLLEQVTRLGGDPSTTLIQVNGSLLGSEDHEVGRENGALVITLLAPDGAAADALRNEKQYEAWRREQRPMPAKTTSKTRHALAEYLESVG
jgi:sulfur carrier protein ThiS